MAVFDFMITYHQNTYFPDKGFLNKISNGCVCGEGRFVVERKEVDGRRCEISPPQGMNNTGSCLRVRNNAAFLVVGRRINQASRVDDEGGTNKVGKQDGGKRNAI